MDNESYCNCIISNSSDPVFITDDNGDFIFVPPKAATIFGYKPKEIIEMANLAQLAKELLVDSQELDQKKEIANFEIEIQGKKGKPLIYLVNIKRVTLDKKARLYSFREITKRKSLENSLKRMNEELELQIEERTNELQKKNIALTEVLSQLEIEKQNIASRVDVNVQKLLLPIIDKLLEKASSFDRRYLMLVKQNLEELTSSIGIKLTSVQYRLTPKEIQLCSLIKGGFTIKEISIMHNLSERTVETHRLNIRKKLGITSSKINLATYLAQL